MARIRTIKPEFFDDDDVGRISPLARVLFLGLLCQADRSGRLEYKPGRLKARILPYDELSADDVESLFDELVRIGMLISYESEGRKLIQIRTFEKHQRPNHREQDSDLPGPSTTLPGKTSADPGKPGQTRGEGEREGSTYRERERERERTSAVGAVETTAPPEPTPTAPVQDSGQAPEPLLKPGEFERVVCEAASELLERSVTAEELNLVKRWRSWRAPVRVVLAALHDAARPEPGVRREPRTLHYFADAVREATDRWAAHVGPAP